MEDAEVGYVLEPGSQSVSERNCLQSLLLIRATGPPPGLPLGRLNEMRDGHYSL